MRTRGRGYVLPMGASAELLERAKDAAANAGVPFPLFAGLIQTESAWKPDAVSKAGALGLAQVMPWWLKSSKFAQYGLTPADLLDPTTNLWMGAEILADELKRFGGNWELAAMAYNGGSPMVRKAIDQAGSTEPAAVSAALPAAETQAYWKKVLKWAAHYEGLVTDLEARVTEMAEDTAAAFRKNGLMIGGGLVLLLVLLAGGRRG